jgi:hypothetical protein
METFDPLTKGPSAAACDVHLVVFPVLMNGHLCARPLLNTPTATGHAVRLNSMVLMIKSEGKPFKQGLTGTEPSVFGY